MPTKEGSSHFAGPTLLWKQRRWILWPVGKFCGALFTDEANGFFDVARIGIALFDQAHGQAVGAEDQMDARAIGKLAQDFADVGDESFECRAGD